MVERKPAAPKKQPAPQPVRTSQPYREKRYQEPVPEPERDFPLGEIGEEYDDGFIDEEDEVIETRSIERIIRDHDAREGRGRFGCVVWLFAIVTIAALVLAIGGLFTHTDITIVPKTFDGAVDQTLTLSQTREPGSLFVGVAAKNFTSELVVPATGVSDRDTKAAGTARFTNSSKTTVTIPAGTSVVSPKSISYVTAKSGTVPKSGTIDIPITAAGAGPDSNSEETTLTFSKPNKSFLVIAIRSVGAISGGSKANISIADPAAIADAMEKIKSNLSDQKTLLDRLAQELPDRAIALPIAIPSPDVSITVDGSKPDGVHVIGSRSASIYVANRNEIARALGSKLGIGDTVVAITSFDGLTVTSADAVAVTPLPQTIHVRITGNAHLVGELNSEALKLRLAGVRRGAAKTILAGIPEIASSDITLRPPWRFTLPSGTNDISIIVK